MSTVVSTVLSLSGWWACLIIGLVAFGEAAAFVGLFLPGETALLLGGVLAATGRVSLPVILVVAAVAAVLGDSVGYEVGRRGGSPVRRSRLGRRIGEERWTRAEQFVLRRGGPAVFLGRWVGVLRALVPALAGMTRMPYRRFLAWNLAGGVTWATTVVLAGYATGAAWRSAAHYFSRAGLVLAVMAVLAGLGWWLVRRRKRSADPVPAPESAGVSRAPAGRARRHHRRPHRRRCGLRLRGAQRGRAGGRGDHLTGPPGARLAARASHRRPDRGAARGHRHRRRARIWTTTGAVVVVLLVGFSRLYLGVHWLTDVLAGYALGVGWLAAVATAFHLTRPEPTGSPQAQQTTSTEESDRVPTFS